MKILTILEIRLWTILEIRLWTRTLEKSRGLSPGLEAGQHAGSRPGERTACLCLYQGLRGGPRRWAPGFQGGLLLTLRSSDLPDSFQRVFTEKLENSRPALPRISCRETTRRAFPPQADYSLTFPQIPVDILSWYKFPSSFKKATLPQNM